MTTHRNTTYRRAPPESFQCDNEFVHSVLHVEGQEIAWRVRCMLTSGHHSGHRAWGVQKNRPWELRWQNQMSTRIDMTGRVSGTNRIEEFP